MILKCTRTLRKDGTVYFRKGKEYIAHERDCDSASLEFPYYEASSYGLIWDIPAAEALRHFIIVVED